MAFTDLWPGVAGGVLIGVAVSLLLLLSGRVANIGGVAEYLIERDLGHHYWRPVFLLGLLLPAPFLSSTPVRVDAAGSWTMLCAGLLVGVGVYLSGGCISGHAVCGNANFSRHAQVATLIFMAAGIVTVYVVRHVM